MSKDMRRIINLIEGEVIQGPWKTQSDADDKQEMIDGQINLHQSFMGNEADMIMMLSAILFLIIRKVQNHLLPALLVGA